MRCACASWTARMWDNHRLLRGVANLLLLASILTLLVAARSGW